MWRVCREAALELAWSSPRFNPLDAHHPRLLRHGEALFMDQLAGSSELLVEVAHEGDMRLDVPAR